LRLIDAHLAGAEGELLVTVGWREAVDPAVLRERPDGEHLVEARGRVESEVARRRILRDDLEAVVAPERVEREASGGELAPHDRLVVPVDRRGGGRGAGAHPG